MTTPVATVAPLSRFNDDDDLFGSESICAALSDDNGGLLLGVATMFAAVAALSRLLLVPAMMKYHSDPFTLNQFGGPTRDIMVNFGT
ncbi:hypothetical protein Hanom_Chr09g00822251 [Helianthus anomalus]